MSQSASTSLDFCRVTQTLLDATTVGDKLLYKSRKTGTIYEADPEHTLLASEEFGESYSTSKFKSTLLVTAYDPINPRIRIDKGCENCGRKVINYQSLGEEKRIYYVCLCGNQWTN